jgi:hypothetical protein
MNNFKISRNLWLFAGICFIISFILSLVSNKSALLTVLNGITFTLMFINAYISHKKMINENKEKD